MDEDLSLNPSTHETKPSMVAHACNLLGRQRQEDYGAVHTKWRGPGFETASKKQRKN